MAREFLDYVLELLEPLGRVDARRMFSGYGLFIDGLMFAIVVDDVLWLKADANNRNEFEDLGLQQFGYSRLGKPARLNFFRPPDEALESSEALMRWARSAIAAALRARTVSTRARKSKP